MGLSERRASIALACTIGAIGAVGVPARADNPAPAGGKALGVRLEPPRYLAVVAPEGWASPTFDDSAWKGPAQGPFAPGPIVGAALSSSAAGTSFTFHPGASLFLRTRFDVDDPARARVLELQVRYADGFVAYLNGREVARRGLGPGRQARPAQPHGPEVERVYLPVLPDVTGALQAKGNLLAIEIKPAKAPSSLLSPSAPAGDVHVAAASGIRIVRGPYLMAPTEGHAGAGLSIAWETDLPGTGVVTIEPAGGRKDAKPRVLRSGPQAVRQVVAVTGLEHARRYEYRVQVTAAGAAADTAAAGPFVIDALADRSRPFRFAVYGDMRAPGHDDHRRVVEALLREAPALVLNTGDMTGEGSEESNWQRYFDITAPLGAVAPVVPALGNHDVARAGMGAAKTWALFGLPSAAPAGTRPGWASLDLGGVHFVILDSSQASSDDQREWLAADLARARRAHARAIFAFLHEGPWSHGMHGGIREVELNYAPLLAEAGVDVLFGGHDHIYERGVGSTPKGPLPYFVTGGGGAPLYVTTCVAAGGDPAQPGLPICPRSVAAIAKVHHYLIVEVGDKGVTICPKRTDGTPVEPCIGYPLHR